MSTAKSIRQVFHCFAPDAKTILLAGDFTDWIQRAVPMRRDADGAWTATVSLAPGTHRYRFVVDGEWRDDPQCKSRVANPFGGQDMLREAA